MRRLALLVAFALAPACRPAPASPADAGVPSDGAVARDGSSPPDASRADATDAALRGPDAGHRDDAGRPDGAGPPDPYAYTAPPPGPPPVELQPATWATHLAQDLLPFWTMPAALGTPEGNFPTWRGMDGLPRGSTQRKPRMLGRQVFAYTAAFMITGDATLLGHAAAGVRWILDHARDDVTGGFHADLDASGAAVGEADRAAQDAAYVAMAPAIFHFATRDAESEAAVVATRDALFDPARFWDATHRRVRDALRPDMATEVDLEDDGGWELVAQLDPMVTFLLLSQPVLSQPVRRAQFIADLRTLATTLRDTFWQDGIFWGVSNRRGQYGSRHVDFGHTLKSYWVLRLLDARLPEHPHHAFLDEHAAAWVDRAFDAAQGRWAKRPTSATTVERGSDWWIHAEADQLAATLALHDARFVDVVRQTSARWRTDYVDRTRPAREVVPSLHEDGTWAWGWSDDDTAKCNEWKSGFHSVEHALVMSLVGAYLEGSPASLYFAVPPAQVATFAATPYLLEGDEVSREDLGEVVVAGQALRKVRVSFARLR